MTAGTLNIDRLQARWEMARRDPVRFLQWFCYTCDQHDSIHPIKQFPIHLQYLQDLTRIWQDNRLLVIVKSRQMRCTWLFVALYLWDAMFHPGRLVMFQSKREDDAIGDEISGDGLLGRAKFIMNHLPGRQLLVPDYTCTASKMLFPSNSSTVWAIPQGAAIIRQRTASGIFSDESAFQDEAGDAYVAARPCIRGGGRYTAVTTADLSDGGHTRALFEDTMEAAA